MIITVVIKSTNCNMSSNMFCSYQLLKEYCAHWTFAFSLPSHPVIFSAFAVYPVYLLSNKSQLVPFIMLTGTTVATDTYTTSSE